MRVAQARAPAFYNGDWLLRQMDHDGNGRVTPSEAVAWGPGGAVWHGQRAFDHLDANADGMISGHEASDAPISISPG